MSTPDQIEAAVSKACKPMADELKELRQVLLGPTGRPEEGYVWRTAQLEAANVARGKRDEKHAEEIRWWKRAVVTVLLGLGASSAAAWLK